MKLVLFLISLLISFNVTATGGSIQGSKEKDTIKVSYCNDKYYGYHKNDGVIHYHEVVWKNDKWNIVDSNDELSANPCGNDTSKHSVKLVRCVDGDTALLNLNGEEIRVRFLAIDTPESVHPTKDVQLYGKDASEYTCKLLTNSKKIEIEYDSGSDKLDKYDRHLVWVWVDNELLQSKLIEVGYARVYYLYGEYKYTNDLLKVEEKAREELIGIWGDETLDYLDYHTVTFNIDGKLTSVSVKDGEKVKAIEPPNKDGYEFVGWFLDGSEYNFGNTVTCDIILSAEFRESKDFVYYIIILIGFIIINLIFNRKLKRH